MKCEKPWEASDSNAGLDLGKPRSSSPASSPKKQPCFNNSNPLGDEGIYLVITSKWGLIRREATGGGGESPSVSTINMGCLFSRNLQDISLDHLLNAELPLILKEIRAFLGMEIAGCESAYRSNSHPNVLCISQKISSFIFIARLLKESIPIPAPVSLYICLGKNQSLVIIRNSKRDFFYLSIKMDYISMAEAVSCVIADKTAPFSSMINLQLQAKLCDFILCLPMVMPFTAIWTVNYNKVLDPIHKQNIPYFLNIVKFTFDGIVLFFFNRNKWDSYISDNSQPEENYPALLFMFKQNLVSSFPAEVQKENRTAPIFGRVAASSAVLNTVNVLYFAGLYAGIFFMSFALLFSRRLMKSIFAQESDLIKKINANAKRLNQCKMINYQSSRALEDIKENIRNNIEEIKRLQREVYIADQKEGWNEEIPEPSLLSEKLLKQEIIAEPKFKFEYMGSGLTENVKVEQGGFFRKGETEEN